MKKIIVLFIFFLFLTPALIPSDKQDRNEYDGCTVIGAGKNATTDGSVITSHTDCCSECRVHVVPGKTYPPGAEAPVYWGMVYFGKEDPRAGKELGDYGTVIGKIPQTQQTFTYFHTGYSQINEHQLAIGESTCRQKDALNVAFVEGVTEQIMTVEQAQIFALQRCRTAEEAVKLIGELVEKYGFLPSCGGAEALCIADPEELWVMEILSVGPEWTRDSGKPGAIWAARRVPDDHIVVIPNYVRIREIDAASPDFLVSPNYLQEAIDRGWHDPESGQPFIWQEAYAPPIHEGELARLWLIYSTAAPSFKDWPRRSLDRPADIMTMYRQGIEGADFYPFSVKPDKKLSVRDIIAYQRSYFADTIYDRTAHPAWLIPGREGEYIKSPLTTPFAAPELMELLGIPYHRTIATQGYGMVAQLRGWLPDPVGGVYWFYVDNPFVSAYIPIYAGVQEIHPYYKTYDMQKFEEDSARWAVDFVEKLLHLRWQETVKDLYAARNPIENEFFTSMAEIDKEASKLYEENPDKARAFLTKLTKDRMEQVVNLFRRLRLELLTKYSGDSF